MNGDHYLPVSGLGFSIGRRDGESIEAWNGKSGFGHAAVWNEICSIGRADRPVEGEQISQTPNVNILWNKSRAFPPATSP